MKFTFRLQDPQYGLIEKEIELKLDDGIDDVWQAIKDVFRMKKNQDFHLHCQGNMLQETEDHEVYNKKSVEDYRAFFFGGARIEIIPAPSLTNDPQSIKYASMKEDKDVYEKIKPFYSYATYNNKPGRQHSHTVTMEGRQETGDALKSVLLKELVSELKGCETLKDLKEKYEALKKEARYKKLEEGQDNMTRTFSFFIPTDSSKAFHKLYKKIKEEMIEHSFVTSKPNETYKK